MMKESTVPTSRFLFFNTLNSTMGFRKESSRQIKKNKPKTAVADKRIIVELLNQSSSWPFNINQIFV